MNCSLLATALSQLLLKSGGSILFGLLLCSSCTWLLYLVVLLRIRLDYLLAQRLMLNWIIAIWPTCEKTLNARSTLMRPLKLSQALRQTEQTTKRNGNPQKNKMYRPTQQPRNIQSVQSVNQPFNSS